MKGFFKPKHPEKYKGNPTNIVYRSSWELNVMLKLDSNPNIIWWQSEEIPIPYRSPIDNRIHRYFVDFICKVKRADGKLKVILIEVKPKKETVAPKKSGKTNKTFIKEAVTWGVNEAKWKAARKYCELNNYEFMILTEDDILK